MIGYMIAWTVVSRKPQLLLTRLRKKIIIKVINFFYLFFLVSDHLVTKAATITDSFSNSEFVDANINLDSVHYSVYDVGCPTNLDHFQHFTHYYMTRNGIYIVCFNMLELLESSRTIQRTSMDRSLSRRSIRSLKSLGRMSAISTVSGTTFGTTRSTLYNYYVRQQSDNSVDSNTKLNRGKAWLSKKAQSIKSKVGMSRTGNKRHQNGIFGFGKRHKRKSSKNIEPLKRHTVQSKDRSSGVNWSKKRKAQSLAKSFASGPEENNDATNESLGHSSADVTDSKLLLSKKVKESLTRLDEWIKTISAHAPHAPILVVGTKLDKVFEINKKAITEVDSLLEIVLKKHPQVVLNCSTDRAYDRYKFGTSRKYNKNVERLFYFPVSNTSKLGIEVVRQKIEAVTRKMSFYNKKIKLKYLNIFDSLLKDKKPTSSFTFKRAVALAKEYGINNELEVKAFLKLFDQLGLLLYKPENVRLEKHILPLNFDLTYLIKRLKSITTEKAQRNKVNQLVPSRKAFYAKFMSEEDVLHQGLKAHLRLFHRRKVLSISILRIIFKGYEKWLEYFISLLVYASILVKWPKKLHTSIQEECYLFPALLEDKVYLFFSPKCVLRYSESINFMTEFAFNILSLNFEASYMPEGIFHTLVAELISHDIEESSKDTKSGNYVVYKNFARLHLSYGSFQIKVKNACLKFGCILKRKNKSIHLIVSDFMLEQERDVESYAVNVNRILRDVSISIKKFVHSILNKIKKEKDFKYMLSWKNEYCVTTRSKSEESKSFKFISEKHAKQIDLEPWFGVLPKVIDNNENLDLLSFLSDDMGSDVQNNLL